MDVVTRCREKKFDRDFANRTVLTKRASYGRSQEFYDPDDVYVVVNMVARCREATANEENNLDRYLC